MVPPTTNTEDSQHERIYKLCGRRQPLVEAMTERKYVDQGDAENLDNGRAAGAYTAIERADHSECRREKQKRATQPRDEGGPEDQGTAQYRDRGVAESGGGEAGSGGGEPRGVGGEAAGHEGTAATDRLPKRRRRVTPAGSAAAQLRIAELEKQQLEERNRTPKAENAALRVGAVAAGSPPAGTMATIAGLAPHQSGMAPPAWFVNLTSLASQQPESTSLHGNVCNTGGGHISGSSS